MIDDDVKQEFEKVNARLDRIEQFLPTVATKDDLARSATKDDLARFATKDDLARFATKDDLARFATKGDLERFATKDDVARCATKDDLEATRREFATVVETLATKKDLERFPTREEMRAEAELTRRHFDLIAESLRDEIRLALEGNLGVTSRVDTLDAQHRRLERRVSTLEASRGRPKK